jgi:hypothetical protein
MSVAVTRERSGPLILLDAANYYRRFLWILLLIASGIVGALDVANVAFGGGSDTFGSPLYSLDLSMAVPLVMGYYIHVLTAPAMAGSRSRLVEGVRRGTCALPVVLIAELVVTVGIGLGFLFFIIPGAVLAVRWCVVAPCISSATSPWKSWYRGIGESARLTSGHFWHALWVIICVALVATVLSFSAGTIPATGSARDIIVVVMQIINVSFGATVLTVLYGDLVARQATH